MFFFAVNQQAEDLSFRILLKVNHQEVLSAPPLCFGFDGQYEPQKNKPRSEKSDRNWGSRMGNRLINKNISKAQSVD